MNISSASGIAGASRQGGRAPAQYGDAAAPIACGSSRATATSAFGHSGVETTHRLPVLPAGGGDRGRLGRTSSSRRTLALCWRPFLEEALLSAHHNWMDHEPELVEESLSKQRPDEGGAARDIHVLSRLPLELVDLDRFREVPL